MASTKAPSAFPVVPTSQTWTIWTLIYLIRTTTDFLHVPEANNDNTMTTAFPLLALPVELRLMIYRHTTLSQRRYRWVNATYHQTRIICPPALLLASRLLRTEALPIFHRIASDEAHIFISGIRNLHDFVQHKAHLLPGLTRLTLMAWKELSQPGVGYLPRLDLCEMAGRALGLLRRGCERLVFLRLQLEVLGKMPEGVVVGTLRELRGLRGVRVVGDRGTMQVLGR